MMPYQNNMFPQYLNPYMQPVQPVPQTRGLSGMIVQSPDRITADCVPMDGSAAFFPKQDMSEIYVKNWCADGTIRTIIYKPIEISGVTTKNDSGASQNVTEVFEQRFDELVGKIDKLEQALLKKRSPATKKEDVE